MPYTGEQKREYQRRWISARRQAWINENGPCRKCGSHDALEVDHINPAAKRFNASRIWGMSVSNPHRVAELAKCQVLCNACHLQKTIAQLSAPCQDRKAERAGCGCLHCKAHKAERMRRWRKTK